MQIEWHSPGVEINKVAATEHHLEKKKMVFESSGALLAIKPCYKTECLSTFHSISISLCSKWWGPAVAQGQS